jgi:hypothetical protein
VVRMALKNFPSFTDISCILTGRLDIICFGHIQLQHESSLHDLDIKDFLLEFMSLHLRL